MSDSLLLAAKASFHGFKKEMPVSFVALMNKSTLARDVKSFLTQQKSNQVLDELENRKEAAGKPPNVKLLLNPNTSTT